MLVIAGQQVPDDVVTMLKAFKDVPVFAASIAVLAVFWRGHWLWSRRYGLEDGVSIFISWTLIFTMLVYVYPLKLVFGGMFHALSRGRLGLPLTVQTIGQGRALFAVRTDPEISLSSAVSNRVFQSFAVVRVSCACRSEW
jgi:hypothetical protein